MENFYQESGRAGRDNLPAKCILLYKFSDIARLSTMVFTEQTGLEKLYGIVAYSLNNFHLRSYVSKYRQGFLLLRKSKLLKESKKERKQQIV